MRVIIHRVKMIGGGTAYDAVVPTADVPTYDPTRYTTISYGDEKGSFLRFEDATLPEEHFSMPQGWERYQHRLAHDKAANERALELLHKLYPETRGLTRFPSLWVTGISEESDRRMTRI